MSLHLNHISENLLLAVKTGKETTQLMEELEKIPLVELKSSLYNDTAKKAFWINIYNSFYQILRKKNGLEKPEIYRGKHIYIASLKWSLDDVEHGILRRFRYKYSLGFLPDPFTSATIRELAVKKVDYRIHFALNCGAKSCPPIAFYSLKKLEKQLETATLSFLESETIVDKEQKEVHITSLFKWYLKDFGNTSGIRSILSQHLKEDFTDYKLIYLSYSWEESLDNYDESNFDG